MEKVKKYFEFSGTINGLNYFLRNLLSSFLAFFGGYMVGYGLGSSQMGLATLGFILLAPTIWFSIATIYKRTLALFPESATALTIGMLVAQVMVQFTQDSVGPVINLGLIIFGLILIFKNSNIQNHEG
jgi:uncharacterized membrane protein YhaH (DUF805 family)